MEMRKDLTRTELQRVCEEFKSERDAAKRDAMRAFDERDVLLNEVLRLRALLAPTDAAAAQSVEEVREERE